MRAARSSRSRNRDFLDTADGHIGETRGEFSVCRFLVDGRYSYVRRYVSAEEAVRTFSYMIDSRPVRSGTIGRLIVTDGGDCTNMEWRLGEGIVYPPPEVTNNTGPGGPTD